MNRVTLYVQFPKELLELEKRVTKKVPKMLKAVTKDAKDFWKTLAGQKLKSSRNAYIKGINVGTDSKLEATLTLTGFLPNAVELGYKGYDMKPGLLAGRTSRVIPLNVNRYIDMKKPKVFATVSTGSHPDSWIHPGWKRPANLAEQVLKEMDTNIIPAKLKELFEDL